MNRNSQVRPIHVKTLLIRSVRRWRPLVLVIGIAAALAVTSVDMARGAVLTPSGDDTSPLSLAGGSAPLGQPVAAHVEEVRTIYTDEFGVPNPVGLAFSPRANMLQVLAANTLGEEVSEIKLVTLFEDPAGSVRVGPGITTPVNSAFDEKANRLLILHSAENQLIEILAGSDGELDMRTLTRRDARHFGLQNPQGMTVDPVSGHVYILDSAGPRLVRVELDPDGGFDDAVISAVDLELNGLLDPRGLAIDPTTGHLHLFDPAEQKLLELTQTGRPIASRDMSELEIGNLQGMIFAPSGDQTDDPLTVNLYLADGGGTGDQQQSGRIIELSFREPVQSAFRALAPFPAAVVQSIDTSLWTPPSPDPAGIVYLPFWNTLLISDSEVNEDTQNPSIWTGDNLFEVTLAGNTLVKTMTTISFSSDGGSDEPTGVTLNPSNGHLFISDDDRNKVYELNPGSDLLYDTPDDVVTFFWTSTFDSGDPEGVTYDSVSGFLFIADDNNNEIYQVDPGPNGVFGGAASSDNIVTHFDTLSLGLESPEGIAINSDSGNLYIVGKSNTKMYEVTTGGVLVQTIDISAANVTKPAGLAYAPSSNSAEMHIYIVFRGVDNDTDPNENDGKLFEFTLPPPAPEMDVQGNSISIADGDMSPSVDDGTDYGNVSVDGGTLASTFTIHNFGSAALNLDSPSGPRVKIFGAHADDYTLTIDATTPVAVGGQTTFQVTFDPSADGLREAWIRIPNNDADEDAYNFDIQGTGAVPEMDVRGNASSIADGDATPSTDDHTDFGDAAVAGGAVIRTFTIQNTGSGDLNLTDSPRVTIAGTHAADFALTSDATSPVLPAGQTTFQVTFDPSAVGLRQATISIANNDADENPYNFSIQGTGAVPEMDVQGNASSIEDGDTTPSIADHTDFGDAAVAGGAVMRTFTIQNTGSADLNLTDSPRVTISGAQAADFTLTIDANTPVAAAGQTTFQVTFDPSALGPRQATISIANDDADENPYDFSIQGTGTMSLYLPIVLRN